MDLIIGTLEQGLIYAILALGVYITYKILDFPDLTADGSFPLGAAITATMISNGGNPVLAMGVSLLAGAAAGLKTICSRPLRRKIEESFTSSAHRNSGRGDFSWRKDPAAPD